MAPIGLVFIIALVILYQVFYLLCIYIYIIEYCISIPKYFHRDKLKVWLVVVFITVGYHIHFINHTFCILSNRINYMCINLEHGSSFVCVIIKDFVWFLSRYCMKTICWHHLARHLINITGHLDHRTQSSVLKDQSTYFNSKCRRNKSNTFNMWFLY